MTRYHDFYSIGQVPFLLAIVNQGRCITEELCIEIQASVALQNL